MLEINSLLEAYTKATQELKSVFSQLQEYRYPDSDPHDANRVYQEYLLKKEKHTDLKIQYTTYLQKHGLRIQ